MAGWPRPDQLLGFIDQLRRLGYNIGVSQYIAAQDLVLELYARGESPDVLGQMLGPLLCSNPTEQADFPQRCDRWLASLGIESEPTKPVGEGAERFRRELEELDLRSKWIPRVVAILAAVGLAAIAYWIYRQWFATDIVVSNPDPMPTPDPVVTSSPTIAPNPIPSATPSAIPSATPTPEEAPISEDCRVREPVDRLFWLGIGFLVPAPAYLAWQGGLLWLANLYLMRRPMQGEPELDRVALEGLDRDVFPSFSMLRIAQGLRRRFRVASPQLDVDRTVQKTVDNAGWFTPAYGFQQVLPEYLVLVDRSGFRDHQARYIEETLNHLAGSGVFMVTYYFSGDPRMCYLPSEPTRLLKLADVLDKYPQHRLLVFADAEVFFNGFTGELEPWVELLFKAPHRVLLTPEPPELWGYPEEELGHIFTVVPASLDALMEFVRRFDSGKPYQPPLGTAAPLPEMLRERPQRWLDRNPPPSEAIAQMFEALQVYLGDRGLYWLGACAIFPKLNWNLTVFLGRVLEEKRGEQLLDVSLLVAMSRLPWFRQGHMPDWMRVEAIAELSDEQEWAVRDALDGLIYQTVSGETFPGAERAVVLEIVKQNADVLARVGQPLLRLLSWRSGKESALRDRLFLDFMVGRKRDRLAVHVPKPKASSKKEEIRLTRPLWKRRQVIQLGVFASAAVGSAMLGLIALTPELAYKVATIRLLGEINGFAFSPNGRLLAVAGGNLIHRWNLADSSLEEEPVEVENAQVELAQFRSTGRLRPAESDIDASTDILRIGANGKLQATLNDGGEVSLGPVEGPPTVTLPGGYVDVRVSSGSDVVATVDANGTVALWQADGAPISILQGNISALQLSPDGERVAVVTDLGEVRLFLIDGTLLSQWQAVQLTRETTESSIGGIQFSPDGQTLATANRDGLISLWDLEGNSIGSLFDFANGPSIDVETMSLKRLIDRRSQTFDSLSQQNSSDPELQQQLQDLEVDVEEQAKRIQQLQQLPSSVQFDDFAFSPQGDRIVALAEGRLFFLPFDESLPEILGPVASAREDHRNEMRTEELGSDVRLEMMNIPPGCFRMGSPESEEDRDDDEGPTREVTIASSFWMGRYPVTQAQWRTVVEMTRDDPEFDLELVPDPSSFKGDDRPVESVSWFDAEEFCKRLSKLTGKDYRLPSEAEWEYACRAGTTTPFHFGPTITTDLANYRGIETYGGGPEGIYRQETTPVDTFKFANAFGLSDMHGNVWEWCADHWHDSYVGAPPGGTPWIEGGDSNRRVLRGGSWDFDPRYCRSANRRWSNPGNWFSGVGFRVVCSSA
ncbi:MAG: SUMF1/EgtB/PvdO family nonheme iron enzyme [Synechococcus sp.]